MIFKNGKTVINTTLYGFKKERILDKILEEIVLSERIINGRTSKPSLGITDAKSAKNTLTAKEKGVMY